MKKTDGLSALMNDFRFDGLPVKASQCRRSA